MKGALRNRSLREDEKLPFIDDMKMRLSLNAIGDRYADDIREYIHLCYINPELLQHYQNIRSSGVFERGNYKFGKMDNQVYKREVIRFPNQFVADFCDTVMSQLYEEDWMTDKRLFKKVCKHPLIKPWLVVNNP